MDYVDIAKVFPNDALPHTVSDNRNEADEYYRRARAIRERFLGSDALLTADSLYQLADTFTEQGHLVNAHSLYQRAMAIYEQHSSAGNQCSLVQLERYTALKARLASSETPLN